MRGFGRFLHLGGIRGIRRLRGFRILDAGEGDGERSSATQPIRPTAIDATMMTPTPTTKFGHGSTATSMPTQPMAVWAKLMSDAAAPVSPSCCDSRMFVL